MGGLLGGSKPKAPKPKEVAPAPTITSEAEDEALQRAGRRRGGYSSQIITGSLVPEMTGKGTMG